MKKLFIGLGIISALVGVALSTPVHAEEVINETPVEDVVETPTEEETTTIIEVEETTQEQEEIKVDVEVDAEEIIQKLKDDYNELKTYVIGLIGLEGLFALYAIGKVALAYLKKNRENLAKTQEQAALLNDIEGIITNKTDAIYNKLSEDDKRKADERVAAAKAYEEELKAIVEKAKVSE